MSYNIIKRETAEDLKSSTKVKKEQFINFNLSTAYFLNDSSIIIQPLNPFGKCLHIFDIEEFEAFITKKDFPATEQIESLYSSNAEIIDNLNSFKATILNSLQKFIFDEFSTETTIDFNKIEYIFSILKKKKKLKTYKLHFILLVADFIMRQNGNYKLGLVKVKQLINPIYRLVIIIDENAKKYYNLEQEIEEKIETFGIKHILSRASSRFKISDELEEIVRIIDIS